MAVEPECMHSSFGVFGSLFFSFCCPVFLLGFLFPSTHLLEVHATGSTVRLASKVTELSYRLVDKEDIT